MSLLEECKSQVITAIRGEAQLPDEFDKNLYAQVSRNVEFLLQQQTKTRNGFAAAWNPNKSIVGMYNWILAAANRLAYYNRTDGSVILRNLAASTEVSLLTGASAEYGDFASLGARLAITLGNTSGAGAAQGYVWDGNTAPASADKAFEAPYNQMVVSAIESGSGQVSKGTHNILVVFTNRTGYESRPAPLNGTFASSGSAADAAPLPFGSTGNHNIQVTITPTGTWPVDYVSAALLITTVQNPARYFFAPGITVPIVGGSSASAVFPVFTLPDVTLAATTTREAVTASADYFSLYSQDYLGNGPFNPFLVLAYSDRAVWFTVLSDGTSGVFVSNKQAPQWITLANHLIQLPEKRQISSGFVLKGTIYFCGPGWTYGASDNTDLPVTWVPPQEVDGRIGTPSPYGVAANSSLGYAFVADTAGLQFFQGGAYASRPVSYLQTPDWERINWAAPAATVQVLDFPARKMVLVKAPLDGATSANYIMAWDYSNGASYDAVNYSLWDSAAMPDIGSIANVLNPTKKVFEVYASRYSPGKVYRYKSIAAGDATEANPTALYDDDSNGITSIYETCPLPQSMPEPKQFVAFRTRLLGNGTILQTAFTSDQNRSHVLPAATAVLAPGRWALCFVDIQSEAFFVQFSNGGVVGSWFLIAAIKPFWTDWVDQR